MRDFKGMKRQRGRSRNNGGGGGKPQHNSNRAFDSNGPEGVKVRGAAQTVYEKYQQLARDAHTSGDRVLAENHLQHAEHYFRVMRVMQPQRPLAEIIGRDQFVSGYDMDFEDESGAAESSESEGGGDAAEAAVERQERGDYRRDDQRQGDARRRDDRPPRDDRRPYERNGGDRPVSDRAYADASGRPTRDDRPGHGRDDRPRFERNDRNPGDPLGIVEPEATPLVGPGPVQNPASTPFLRADDGEVSHAPAFLQARPAEPRPAEPRQGESSPTEAPSEPRRPRRRGSPRAYENAPVGADES